LPTTILLIRHGETEWNRGKIFRGTYDIPLNGNGRAQAALAAKALGGRKIDAAYSSPLSRAMETARITLADKHVPITVEKSFIDFNYGEWTGLEERAVAEKWPGEYAQWTSEPDKVRPPGGDTLGEVYDRAYGALEQIAGKHANGTVAVFAHRVVNKLLVLAMLTLGPERFTFIRQDNCCINEFTRTEAGYITIAVNDTSHLREAGAGLLQADF